MLLGLAPGWQSLRIFLTYSLLLSHCHPCDLRFQALPKAALPEDPPQKVSHQALFSRPQATCRPHLSSNGRGSFPSPALQQRHPLLPSPSLAEATHWAQGTPAGAKAYSQATNSADLNRGSSPHSRFLSSPLPEKQGDAIPAWHAPLCTSQ